MVYNKTSILLRKFSRKKQTLPATCRLCPPKPSSSRAEAARAKPEALVDWLLAAATAKNLPELAESALLPAGDLERCLAWAWLSLREFDSESQRSTATLRTMELTDILLAALLAAVTFLGTLILYHLKTAADRAKEDREVNRAEHARLFGAVDDVRGSVTSVEQEVADLKRDVAVLRERSDRSERSEGSGSGGSPGSTG